MSMKEVNTVELDERINKVALLLLKGFPRREIVKGITNDYKVCVKTADNYIAKAKQMIIVETKSEREEMLAIAIARYNDLYKKNYNIQDYRECRSVQESINRLFGLEKLLHEHTGKDGKVLKITFREDD